MSYGSGSSERPPACAPSHSGWWSGKVRGHPQAGPTLQEVHHRWTPVDQCQQHVVRGAARGDRPQVPQRVVAVFGDPELGHPEFIGTQNMPPDTADVPPR